MSIVLQNVIFYPHSLELSHLYVRGNNYALLNNETIKIKAYPFDDAGNIVAKITESSAPEGMTEDKFFAKPILTKEDLAAALT